MNSSFTYYSKKVIETLDSIGTNSTQENQNISLTKEEQAQLGLLKTAWKYLEKAIRYIGLGNFLDWFKGLGKYIKFAIKSLVLLFLGGWVLYFILKILKYFNIWGNYLGEILIQLNLLGSKLLSLLNVIGIYCLEYWYIIAVLLLIYLIWKYFTKLEDTTAIEDIENLLFVPVRKEKQAIESIGSILNLNSNNKPKEIHIELPVNTNITESVIKTDYLQFIVDHKEFIVLGILGFLTIVGYYFTPKRRNTLLQLNTQQQQQQQANNNNLQVIQPLEVRIRNMANGNSVEYHDPQTGNLRSTQDLRDTLSIIVNYARNHPNSGFNLTEYLCAGTIRIFGPNNRFLRFDRDFHDQPSLENLDETSNNLLDPLMNSLNSIELQLANEENRNDEEAILQLQSQRDTLRDQILDNSLTGSFVLDIHVDNNQEFQEIANAENSLRETNLAAQQIVAESDESNLSGLNQNLNYGILFNQAIKAAIKDKEHENKHYWNFGLFKVRKLSSNLPRKPRSDSLIGLYADLYQSQPNSRKGSIDLNDSSNLAIEDESTFLNLDHNKNIDIKRQSFQATNQSIENKFKLANQKIGEIPEFRGPNRFKAEEEYVKQIEKTTGADKLRSQAQKEKEELERRNLEQVKKLREQELNYEYKGDN